MNVLGVIYPQYWSQPNCESTFVIHQNLIKQHYYTSKKHSIELVGRTSKHCYSHVCLTFFINDIFPFQTTIVDWNDDDKVRIGMNAQLLKVVIAIFNFFLL
jgi:hypothetical protein